MQRKSWNASRLERLKAALKKEGNTPEAFNTMMEFEDLLPLEAQELSEQVNWPRVRVQDETIFTNPATPQMVVKSFNPPELPPKIVIKRY